MLSFLSRKKPTSAHINGLPAITVQPKETLLQAALREGIDFPHSCRVGGCAACKCRLKQGRVKELTQSAYILSDAELDQGYILACQSVPQTDVVVDVDMSRHAEHRRVSGRVVGQDRLTHDIVQLRVQLDESLPYKGGQFALLSVAPLGTLSRSYSFASAPRPDAQVSFFVRQVPGGAVSTLLNERDVVGQTVTLDGPMGDFWLRPGDTPLMLIAGGSGLAPVLALLQQALAERVNRPATLLFGVREARDLYAQDLIADIAARWPNRFTFVPVLSDASSDASWDGERGMVADVIRSRLEPGAHAYLCGPPPMVDACAVQLQQCGIPVEHIHTDRFTTAHDASSAAA